MTDGDYKYLLSMEQAYRFKGGQVQTGRWMKKYFTADDREFMRQPENVKPLLESLLMKK